eukprot:7601832-Lingulodinium_polyedra.AAC.1
MLAPGAMGGECAARPAPRGALMFPRKSQVSVWRAVAAREREHARLCAGSAWRVCVCVARGQARAS